MKKLKYTRTIYYDKGLKKWVSFYVNDNNETIIEKTSSKQKDLIKQGYTKGNLKKLNKKKIDEYSFLLANKNDRRFDHIIDFSSSQKKLDSIMKKPLLEESDYIKAESMSPKERKKFLKKFATKEEIEFLNNTLDNPYMEYKIPAIKEKLKIKQSGSKTGEHIIKNVAVFKYSKTGFYIPTREQNILKDILKNKRKVQLNFTVGDEKFFTPFFKPSKKTNYEKMFTDIVNKYPSKIKWKIQDIKINIKE